MEFAALDPGKLLVLMIAGGVFALAGLWLMFRPKPEGSRAKIELFGLKFESSSAGLLVFMIGAAFLALPLFVPSGADNTGSAAKATSVEDPAVEGAEQRTEAGRGEVATSTPQPAAVTARPARALTAVGEEVEPNDNIAVANEIAIGSVIHGEVEAGNPDFYTFTFPDDYIGRFTANLSGDRVGFSTYDDLGGLLFQSNSKRFNSEVEYSRYYVSVGTGEKRAGYTLTVGAREELSSRTV
ncbi:MAG: hypothetical protein AAGH83_07960 [Pseudomonadota bacterium]